MEDLTEDQIQKLNELSKLPQEQQQAELQKIISTMSPGQVEFLKSQQKQQQCLFCSIVEFQAPQYRIYEDSSFIGILDINPASKGHVIIIPKKHYKFINEVEEDFSIPIKKITNKIYDVLQADVSIIINNGEKAGQKLPHTSISIIPRYENDNIKIEWESKQAPKEELSDLSEKLTIPKESHEIEEEKVEEIEDYEEDERIP